MKQTRIDITFPQLIREPHRSRRRRGSRTQVSTESRAPRPETDRRCRPMKPRLIDSLRSRTGLVRGWNVKWNAARAPGPIEREISRYRDRTLVEGSLRGIPVVVVAGQELLDYWSLKGTLQRGICERHHYSGTNWKIVADWPVLHADRKSASVTGQPSFYSFSCLSLLLALFAWTSVSYSVLANDRDLRDLRSTVPFEFVWEISLEYMVTVAAGTIIPESR